MANTPVSAFGKKHASQGSISDGDPSRRDYFPTCPLRIYAVRDGILRCLPTQDKSIPIERATRLDLDELCITPLRAYRSPLRVRLDLNFISEIRTARNIKNRASDQLIAIDQQLRIHRRSFCRGGWKIPRHSHRRVSRGWGWLILELDPHPRAIAQLNNRLADRGVHRAPCSIDAYSPRAIGFNIENSVASWQHRQVYQPTRLRFFQSVVCTRESTCRRLSAYSPQAAVISLL